MHAGSLSARGENEGAGSEGIAESNRCTARGVHGWVGGGGFSRW